MAPHVIFTCFAGRERYMKILLPYVHQLVDMKLVDEVHIWDYTWNESDSLFIREVCARYTLCSVRDKSNYKEYYSYYTQEKYPDPQTVLVKCDDDIVFIDVPRFRQFIEARRACPNPLLFSPSVINNPICQAIQIQRGVLPGFDRKSFDMTAENAVKIHDYFLNHMSEFLDASSKTSRFSELPLDMPYRFNINFFAILAKDFGILKNVDKDDEHFLGVVAPSYYQRHIVLDMAFVVCHMAYTAQRQGGYDETHHLNMYSTLQKEKCNDNGDHTEYKNRALLV